MPTTGGALITTATLRALASAVGAVFVTTLATLVAACRAPALIAAVVMTPVLCR